MYAHIHYIYIYIYAHLYVYAHIYVSYGYIHIYICRFANTYYIYICICFINRHPSVFLLQNPTLESLGVHLSLGGYNRCRAVKEHTMTVANKHIPWTSVAGLGVMSGTNAADTR